MLRRSLLLLLWEEIIIVHDNPQLLRRCLVAVLLLIEVRLLSLRLPKASSTRASTTTAKGATTPASPCRPISLLVAAAALTVLKPASSSASSTRPLLPATRILAAFLDHVVQAHGEPSRHGGLLRHSLETNRQRCSRSIVRSDLDVRAVLLPHNQEYCFVRSAQLRDLLVRCVWSSYGLPLSRSRTSCQAEERRRHPQPLSRYFLQKCETSLEVSAEQAGLSP